MIVSVCSDKGSPGVSTLVMALGLVWPAGPVVLDADATGGDLPFRLWTGGAAGRSRLAPTPSITGLATAARLGLTEAGPRPFAQDTSLGVPVIPGVLSADRFAGLNPLWPRLAGQLAAWPGTVLADLGRLQPGNPAVALARESAAVLLVSRADLESLAHLRDRAAQLSAALGDPRRTGPAVGVVVTGPTQGRRFALEQVRQVLASVGCPAPVLGFVAHDPRAARALWAGRVTRALAGSELVRSVKTVAGQVLATWPTLMPTPIQEPAPEPAVAPAASEQQRVAARAAQPVTLPATAAAAAVLS